MGLEADRTRELGSRASAPLSDRSADHPPAAGGGGDAVGAEAGDRELATALAAGDQAALAGLFDRFGGLAYGVALRILGDPGRAEDAVQDAFLSVWHRASTFDASRGSLRTWLLAAVRHRSIDLLRGRGAHERREVALDLAPAATTSPGDPWREVALSLERAAVRDAMMSLPPEQRQAVELAYFGGYTQAEIADVTHVPLGTVKGRLRLALEKMGSFLRGRGLVDV